MRQPILQPRRLEGDHNTLLRFVFLLFLAALLMLTTIAFSQELIKDINRNENPNVNEYSEAVDINGTLFFTSAGELWKTTGTKETSSRVKKFNSINFLTRSGNILYFNAADASGEELWKSDGTPAGTVRVKDIYPGELGSGPQMLTTVGTTLFFVANDGVHGSELWKSDGTMAGTSMVKDLMSGSSNPSYLTNVNGTLFFVANDGTHGYELWKTNGTPDKTVLVSDIKPEFRKSSYPKLLTNVNGLLYFTAEDDEAGRELWKSNGTASGTLRVKDIFPGITNSFLKNLVAVNGVLFFSANDGVHGHELWKSNGTSGGTMMVKDLTPGPRGSDDRYSWREVDRMSNFTDIDGTLYFTAYNSNVYSAWKSDGTEAGTKAIFTIEQDLFLAPGLRAQFTKLNSSVYFYNPTNRNYPTGYLDLMREDASGNVTRISTLALWDYYDSKNQFLVKSGNYLYMTGRRTINSGYALLKSDGMSQAEVVIDSYKQKDQSSNPEQFVTMGNYIYFVATAGLYENDQASHFMLMKSDGTTIGTSKIFDAHWIRMLGVTGGNLYFVASDGAEERVYKSDGTSAGTVDLHYTSPTVEHTWVTYLTMIGTKRFYVWGSYQNYPAYLWIDDGVGTKQIGAFDAASDFHVAGNYLFFKARNASVGEELWRSDGTAEGTRMVKDIYPGAKSSSPGNLTDYKGLLYFTSNDGVHGFELWRSNGMASGTMMIKDLSSANSTNLSGGVQQFQIVNGVLYFTSREYSKTTLWKTTGTSSGTVLIKEVPGTRWLIDGGNQLLMIMGADGENTLWKSKGTAETTTMVTDLPGFYYSYLSLQTMAINNVAYFSVSPDLWRTDGTSCGTFKVPLTLEAYNFAHLGNEIIFAGADPVIGTELFKINTANIVVDCPTTIAAASTSMTSEEVISNYPNPFTSSFALRHPGVEGSNYTVVIYNMDGQIVETHQYECNQTYMLGTPWPTGLYLIKMIHEGRTEIIRVLKDQ